MCYYYNRKRIDMEKQEGKGLFKKLDLAFVYIFIFLVGVAIVLAMTSYINNKVKEFSDDAVAYSMKR